MLGPRGGTEDLSAGIPGDLVAAIPTPPAAAWMSTWLPGRRPPMMIKAGIRRGVVHAECRALLEADMVPGSGRTLPALTVTSSGLAAEPGGSDDPLTSRTFWTSGPTVSTSQPLRSPARKAVLGARIQPGAGHRVGEVQARGAHAIRTSPGPTCGSGHSCTRSTSCPPMGQDHSLHGMNLWSGSATRRRAPGERSDERPAARAMEESGRVRCARFSHLAENSSRPCCSAADNRTPIA